MASTRPRLHVRKGCPHCAYILEQLEKLKLKDKLDIVESDSKIVPALEIDGRLEPVMGNVYGVLKLYLYLLERHE